MALCFWNQHKKYEYYVQVHAAWEKEPLRCFLFVNKTTARSRAQCSTILEFAVRSGATMTSCVYDVELLYRGLAAARFVTSFHQEKLESRVGGKSKVRWACGPLPRAGNGHGGEHAAVVVCLSAAVFAQFDIFFFNIRATKSWEVEIASGPIENTLLGGNSTKYLFSSVVAHKERIVLNKHTNSFFNKLSFSYQKPFSSLPLLIHSQQLGWLLVYWIIFEIE